MKLPIKLPVTEKFLWDLYNMVKELDDTSPSQPLSIREVICPDLREIRENYNKKHNRWLFSKLIDYLKRKGYIRIKNLENKKEVILTPKGVV